MSAVATRAKSPGGGPGLLFDGRRGSTFPSRSTLRTMKRIFMALGVRTLYDLAGRSRS